MLVSNRNQDGSFRRYYIICNGILFVWFLKWHIVKAEKKTTMRALSIFFIKILMHTKLNQNNGINQQTWSQMLTINLETKPV